MHHPRSSLPRPLSSRHRAPDGSHRWLALALATGLLLLAASCGEVILRAEPDAGTPPGAPDAAPSATALADSFEIEATLTYDESIFVPIELLPRQHAFVLRLDDGLAGRTEAIAGTAGQVSTGRFDRMSDGRRVLRSALSLGMSGLDACGLGNVSYESMELEVYDDDGDGRPDRIQGTATGRLEQFLGDFLDFARFEATLTGRLDDTPPTLGFNGSASEQSIFGDVLVTASEPLAPGATLTLRDLESDTSIDMIPFPEDQVAAVAYFYTPPGQLLPFGTTLAVTSDQDVRDLAGNALGSLELALQTIPDPGLFAQDGFESMPRVHLRGDARLIEGEAGDDLPTIDGARSLYLGPGGSATFRVRVENPGDELSLALSVRGLASQSGDVAIPGGVTIATPDGSLRVSHPFPALSVTEALASQDWTFISPEPPEVMSISLPPFATGELLVELRVNTGLCTFGPQPLGAGVIVDDLIVQPPPVIEPSSLGPGTGR